MKTLLFLLLPFFFAAQTSEQYYSKAVESIDRGSYSEAEKQIDKAILLDADNLEYRWIKSRVNLTSNSSDNNFLIAIENLNFILNKGEKSSKIYNALGIAERELGLSIRNYKRPEKNNSFRDDNTEEIEQLNIYKDALKHLTLASEYFQKAEELKSGSTRNANDYLANDIKELKSKID